MNNKLQSLQNAADIVGATVHPVIQGKKERFTLTYNGTGISPVLDYDNMNHFILGMIKAKEIEAIAFKIKNTHN